VAEGDSRSGGEYLIKEKKMCEVRLGNPPILIPYVRRGWQSMDDQANNVRESYLKEIEIKAYGC
jgi:hypothetical protein